MLDNEELLIDYDELHEAFISYTENQVEEEYLMMYEIMTTPWF